MKTWQRLLKIAQELLIKSCEPMPVTPWERWIMNRPEPRFAVNPVVPFGGF